MRISDLPKSEQPRKRLIKYGASALSDAELLALILRQGGKKYNVIQVSQNILQKHTIKELSQISINTIKQVQCIGEVKASQIIACFELGRRAAAFQEYRKKIETAEDIVNHILPHITSLQKEHLIGIYLDARKKIIKQQIISIGSVSATIIHPREVFLSAIKEHAVAIILVHNHPSGDPEPSEADIEVTKQLQKAGELLEIELLDHIIIGEQSYCSMKESGIM